MLISAPNANSLPAKTIKKTLDATSLTPMHGQQHGKGMTLYQVITEQKTPAKSITSRKEITADKSVRLVNSSIELSPE
jgi:hypothetical protein